MPNKKYRPLIIILIIIAALGLLLAWGKIAAKQRAEETSPIFFYGDTCPHCKNVEQYINDNNIRAKLKFRELEVYNNKDNAIILAEKARQCQLDITQGIGVPFFFDGQNCLVGDQEIIKFLSAK